MRYIQMFVLLLLPCVVQADIYEHRDANGEVTYSDQPSLTAKKVILPPVSVVNSSEPALVIPSTQDASAGYSSFSDTLMDKKEASLPAAQYYKQFELTSPISEQTFQNQRHFSAQVSLEPELREGNRIQFLVDGKPYGEASSSSSTVLSNLDRGTHYIQAQLLDEAGNVVKSTASATIYIHYAKQ